MNILEIQNLTKSFGGVRALSDCTFAISEKTITALIGPNGAGKTTLFNCVNGFVSADEGKIFFAGAYIQGEPAWRRSRLGMSRTFQLSRFFRNLSIRENLLLAMRQNDDKFWRMLYRPVPDAAFEQSIAGMLKFVGLEKDLATFVTDLSYGQQKLFDLAKALLNPHTLLLMDEPAAGINPVLRTKLIDLLHELKKRGETILLIEHDMDFVRQVADHVIVMDQGAVLAEGEPETVLRDNRVLEAYLGKI
jgi:ABC-type branched-subunit amino acid transport system ATPase component